MRRRPNASVFLPRCTKSSRKPWRRESTLGKVLRATVHRRPRQLADGRKDYPKVCLSGVWLEDAGFLIGRRYEVEVSEGQLVLRTV
jgi:hypothetical protein